MARPKSYTNSQLDYVIKLLSQGSSVRGIAKIVGLSQGAVQRIKESAKK